MRKTRFSEEHDIAILKQAEAGMKVAGPSRQVEISEASDQGGQARRGESYRRSLLRQPNGVRSGVMVSSQALRPHPPAP